MLQFKDFSDFYTDNETVVNHIVSPGGHLAISRANMPQIDQEDKDEFFKFMESRGVTFRKVRMDVKYLKLAQGEYHKLKVWSLMKKFAKSMDNGPLPLVSSDGFILDGSHRFLAKYNLQRRYIDVMQANVNIHRLIPIARQFNKAKFRTVHESKTTH